MSGASPGVGGLRPRPLGRWEDDGGRVVLLKPRFGHGRAGRAIERWFQPRPLRIRLDEVGSFVWRRLDGDRTVEQIAREMRNAFGTRVEPVTQRLATFLRQLEHGRWVAADGPGSATAATGRGVRP